VFYNPETGGQWKDLWLGLKKADRKARINDVTWDTFRHSFASRLTPAGADLVTVKELQGHFGGFGDDALRAYKPGLKGPGGEPVEPEYDKVMTRPGKKKRHSDSFRK
jgi:hypothetical protein